MKVFRILFSLFAFALLPMLAHGQQYELSCPSGTWPLSPIGTTFDASTNRYRQWICMDGNGKITIQGNTVIASSSSTQLCNINGALHVGNGTVYNSCWGSSDIGAQINAAYLALPSDGGRIVVDPKSGGGCYSYSTPIVMSTANKYPWLEGGGPANGGGSGACLNYTPTTATSAITLDYADATNISSNHGIRNISLINNSCISTGGCGSSATGIQIGTSNSGSYNATFNNITITGFAFGYKAANTASVLVAWNNASFEANGVALGYGGPQTERFFGGTFAGNGQIAVTTAAGATPELYFSNTNSFVNTGGGTAFDFTTSTNPGTVHMSNVHLENSQTSTAHYFEGKMNVFLSGGLMEDDNSTGTGDWMLHQSGNVELQINGTLIFSNRAYTQVILADDSARGLINAMIMSPTNLPTIVGGANSKFISQMNLITNPGTNNPSPWILEPALQLRRNLTFITDKGQHVETQAATSDISGTCTLASASPSTCTVTFTTAYTATPVCVASNRTTQANSIKVVPSTTNVVFTGPNTVTDVVQYICIGNPN